MKTAADQARAMGDYIRENGFSPEFDDESVGPQCGCFIHAAQRLDMTLSRWLPIEYALLEITGATSCNDDDLIAAGYASDADRSKAVEACYAAARMLEAQS